VASFRRELTNLPNLVTMSRVVLIPFVLFFIDNFSPLRSFIAGLLYLVAAAGDFVDGYLARKPGEVSTLGSSLTRWPTSCWSPPCWSTWWRSRASRPGWSWCSSRAIWRDRIAQHRSAQGLVIAASDGGKIKTALQLVAIMMLLIYFRYPALGTSIQVDYQRRGGWCCTSRPPSLCSRECSTCAISSRPRCNSRARRRDRGQRPGARPGRSRPPRRRAAGGVLADGAGGRRRGRRARSGGHRPDRDRRPHPDDTDDGLASLDRMWRAARAAWGATGAPVAAGIPVAVGWLSYELGRRLVGLAPDPRATWATLEFHVHDAVWAREADGSATIFARDAAAAARLAAVLATEPGAGAAPVVGPIGPEAGDEVFLAGVARILEYLQAGTPIR
jgi:CDP-diacylglycerol--glycerol-3-phosphate 3-phosphatidyltransferase